MGALADWIRSQGGTAHLEVREESGEGRGAFATRTIEHGARLLSVPHALLLTPDVVGATGVGRALESCPASAPLVGDRQFLLAAYLLLSQKGGSPWAPYVDSLPEAAPDVPVLYDDSELATLEGSWILSRVRHERALFRRQYDAIVAALPMAADYSLDDYLRCRTLVPSRVFAVLGTEALVPMADMLNHRRVPDVEWGYEHPTESFVMRATRDIAAGEAVHDSYGKKSNGLLFEIYGFCVDDQSRDEAELRLPGIDPNHPLAAGSSTFGRVVGGERAFRVAATPDRAEESAAITYLRRALGDSAPLDAADASVRRTMLGACDRALAAFASAPASAPVSASVDGSAAPSTATSEMRTQKCLGVCASERRVLLAVRARYDSAPVA